MSSRGKLKIFLGYAAGVGKTYQMLEEAQGLKCSGVDVVIGYFEPHGRQETIALLKTQAQISVLVADNDAESHAGFDLCHTLTGYPWPLTAVIAQKRGIAQVRNTLIEHALKTDTQFIAMIDDDEWPDSQ